MRNEAGFTLVELLAALVAGGLLLALVGAMTGAFGDELRQRRRDPFDRVANVAPMLETLLSSATPSALGKTRFMGDERHMEAEVLPLAALGPIGPLKLTLDVVRDGGGDALDLTLTPVDPDARDPRLPTKRRLLEGLRGILFSYTRGDDGDEAAPPRLITLSFDTGGTDPWKLAIATRLNAIGGCRFDPISLTCRA